MESNIPIIISCGIILHHYKKHYNGSKLTLLEKFVQLSDIDNHETWALFFLGIAIGMKIDRVILNAKRVKRVARDLSNLDIFGMSKS